MTSKIILHTLILASLSCYASKAIEEATDKCKDITSCVTCLSTGKCVWCVNKSHCATEHCGNDNVIHPARTRALMSGSQFCPRVVLPESDLIIQSGKQESIVVKITQIYMYMSFTPWKCKISFDGKELVTNAMLLLDQVFCDPVVLSIDTDIPYMTGSVSVLWEYSKSFDGSLPIKVCRCDLDPSCVACTKQEEQEKFVI